MPESAPTTASAYQLRVVLRGVSPLIWRRLLVRSESSIADLHATLQLVLGWSDDHLHRFVIHAREYGVAYLGGISFRDDARRVRLGDLGLRTAERFLHEYDFGDGWQHDIRVERILPLEPGRCYPVCIGGRRAVPPEGCGGPWAFLELRQRHSILGVTRRLLELGETGSGDLPAAEFMADHDEELMELCRWLRIDHFDRRAANRRLAGLGATATARSVA